jgi:hypothetical protein
MDESRNGKIRDEFLNENWFFSVSDARDQAFEYQRFFNSKPLYGSLFSLTCKKRNGHPIRVARIVWHSKFGIRPPALGILPRASGPGFSLSARPSASRRSILK